MVVMPVQEYPYFSEQIALDGVIYIFEFYWNERGSFWSLSIYDKNNNILIAGLRIVKNLNLLSNYSRPDIFPNGALVAMSQTLSDNTEISYEDLSSGLVQLVYIPVSDYANIQSV
jgi:hypothetical protein